MDYSREIPKYEIDLLKEIYSAPTELKRLYKTVRALDKRILVEKISFESNKWYKRTTDNTDKYIVYQKVIGTKNKFVALSIPNQLLSLTELYAYLYGRIHENANTK